MQKKTNTKFWNILKDLLFVMCFLGGLFLMIIGMRFSAQINKETSQFEKLMVSCLVLGGGALSILSLVLPRPNYSDE